MSCHESKWYITNQNKDFRTKQGELNQFILKYQNEAL